MVDSMGEMGRAGGPPIGGVGAGTGPADTDAIRADIRQTRERMSHTLDGIGERLNPNHIREQVKQNLRDATIGRAEHMARNAANRVTETRHSLMDTLRDNPIPAAMVGVGLGWLMYNRRESDGYSDTRYGRGYGNRYPAAGDRYPAAGDRSLAMGHEADWSEGHGGKIRDQAGELTDRAQYAVGDLADRTRETVGDVAEQTQDMVRATTDRARSMAEDVASETRYRAHRAEDRLHDALDDNPLVIGAAALAVGLAAGLAVPSTRREAELMGDARDKVVSRARDAAEHAADRALSQARDMAHETAGRVIEQARERAEETTERMQAAADRVIDETEHTVRDVAEEQGLLPEDDRRGGEQGNQFRA